MMWSRVSLVGFAEKGEIVGEESRKSQGLSAACRWVGLGESRADVR
jgi:hypothetical protein